MSAMQTRVGPEGRVLIPAALRRQLGIDPGSSVLLCVEGDHLVLLPRDAIKRRLRAMFAHVEGSMAEELIAERHAEAARDLEEG